MKRASEFKHSSLQLQFILKQKKTKKKCVGTGGLREKVKVELKGTGGK